MAIVRGPTPPGTGVIAPGDFMDFRMNVADQHRTFSLEQRTPRMSLREDRRGKGRIGHDVDPDVDDGRAGLDKRPSHEPWPPKRRNQDVGASRDTRGRSWVREWQIVTVAWRWSKRSETGFPTISLRPMMTACLPATSMLAALQQFDDAGSECTRRGRRDSARVGRR